VPSDRKGKRTPIRIVARNLIRGPVTALPKDGRQAVILQCWENPENDAGEHRHKNFRFSADHWLMDIVLLDVQSRAFTNLTSVERVSFYNHGLHF